MRWSSWRWVCSAAVLCCPVAIGHAQRGAPGSLLLFPECDARVDVGRLELITVTNTELLDTTVVWEYVDGTTCSTTRVYEPLRKADTLTVVAPAHAAVAMRGYLFVYAVEPLTNLPIVHNHLIGTSTILDGLDALQYTVEPLCFEGIGDGVHTDLDFDGRRDLDGVEYDSVPAELVVPRFIGQTNDVVSELILIDLTGGAGFDCSTHVLLYNDNEVSFSAEYTFECWTKTPLLSISPGFSRTFLASTNHDPAEILGASGYESGWIRLHGDQTSNDFTTIQDPALVAVLVEGRGESATKTAIQATGLGRNENGSLPPNGGAAPGRER